MKVNRFGRASKNAVAAVFAATLCASAVPALAFAADGDRGFDGALPETADAAASIEAVSGPIEMHVDKASGLKYSIDELGQVTVRGVSDPESLKTLSIPEAIAGRAVTAIRPDPTAYAMVGAGTFTACSNLESVTIPDSVKVIGAGSFERCAKLASVRLPEKGVELESGAFRMCHSLVSVRIPQNAIIASDADPFFNGGLELIECVKGSPADEYGERAGIKREYFEPNPDLDPAPVAADVTRLWGPNALGTMRSVVDEGFVQGSCDSVVVATMDGYWDALTASGIAGLEKCPVLITDGSELSSETSAEIERLGAKTVYIAGGPAAVSAHVEDQIAKLPA